MKTTYFLFFINPDALTNYNTMMSDVDAGFCAW